MGEEPPPFIGIKIDPKKKKKKRHVVQHWESNRNLLDFLSTSPIIIHIDV